MSQQWNDNQLDQLVENEIRYDAASVWRAAAYDPTSFRYSDGGGSERYLERVLSSATNLSSSSPELEGFIRDWTSEYHLSPSRADLLRGFDFDRSGRVLEVGCGCGAITRFLGETFAAVVGVEGSYARARLARLRTRDLANVSILCAPFQTLRFREAFDHVFCIGVLEYAPMFVTGEDPYDVVLTYLRGLLARGGTLVLAIENQFGLKYWASSHEDHTGVMFEGVEGYPRRLKAVRTFGYDELRQRLARYFDRVEFYFPYPDYKTPRCVLSQGFFERARVAELVSGIASRDYAGRRRPVFDETLAAFELDRNGKLHFFANSFLVVAHGPEGGAVRFPHLGVMYSSRRAERYRVTTEFVDKPPRGIVVRKVLAGHQAVLEEGRVVLRASQSEWVHGVSIQTSVLQLAKARDLTLDQLLMPCLPWLNALREASIGHGDRALLGGEYLDRIWKNSYLQNGKLVFVDAEWSWREPIPLKVVAIRAVYMFLEDVASSLHDVNPNLRGRSRRQLITEIARVLGLALHPRDFSAFCVLEAELTSIVYSRSRRQTALAYRLALDAEWILRLHRLSRRVANKVFNWSRRVDPFPVDAASAGGGRP